jgi:hypothetical protein
MKVLAALAALGVSSALVAARAADVASAPIARYTANALNMGGDEGPAATLVEIDIDRWSTEDEHNKLAAPLASNGQTAAHAVLRKLPRVGILRTLNPPGEPLHYAWRTVAADGSERLLLIGSRPMRSFERSMKANMSAFPFAVIELSVDATGNGSGTLALAATLTGRPERPIVPVPDRLVLPVRLTKVKRLQ